MNSSIKTALLLIITGLFLFPSCKKENVCETKNKPTQQVEQSSQRLPTSFCGSGVTAELIAGRIHRAGYVTINNDANNYYITYKTSGNWYLNRMHLYLGVASNAPADHDSHPIPGMFPYMGSGMCKEFTFVVSRTSVATCFDILANAVLTEVDDHGNFIRSEEGWGFGQYLTPDGHPATFFKYCYSTCVTIEGEGCSMSQGYWFANPVAAWPSTGVTVGGHTYTKSEALGIWNTSNAGGIKHSKKAFQQVATIYLSSSTISVDATVWADVAICENWLASLGKLSPSNLPSGNLAVSEAAGRIGDWIAAHHCD